MMFPTPGMTHGFLYYTRTDFMPFADSQKRPTFIR